MSTAPGPATGPAAVYRERRAAFAEEEGRWARRSFRLSAARFAAFLAGALCLLAILVQASAPRPVWIAGAGVSFAAFAALLVVHERVIRRERRFHALVAINDEGLARIERAWAALPLPSQPPLPGSPAGAELPPLSRDLGLFGHASLFHLLGTVHTPPGKAALAAWLLAPADPREIAARQEAVRELAPEIDLRQELEQRVREMERVPPDCEPFLLWAEEDPWLLPRRGLVLFSWLSPVVTVGLLAAAILTPLPWWPFLLALAVNLLVMHLHGEPIESTFARVAAREREFLLYAQALEVLGERSFASARLQRVEAELAARGRPAHAWMELLGRRLALADVRRTAIFSFLFQSLLLWDLHLVRLLERWRRDAGHRARAWLTALGDFEALAALAALAHDNPDWALPRVDPTVPPLFEARDLGHPLLPATVRVGNDVTVGPPGTFLLVTGSNMSGKSTLLRSIGVNAILAQAGGPVSATALTLPPLALATSVLVEDSLADGVSFFLAELKRVRQVVDAADRAAAEGRRLLYLLDEVLRGTNSYERQVAVRRVILHLLAKGALGAVSTHDLQLAEIEDLKEACLPVHFRESWEAGRMTFDYKMRPGVATTTNALDLLAMVGLGPEGEESPSPPQVGGN